MTPIVVSNEIYGDTFGILHEIGVELCVIAMSFLPPIGTRVALHFVHQAADPGLGETPTTAIDGLDIYRISAQAIVYEHEYTGRYELVRRVMFRFTGDWS